MKEITVRGKAFEEYISANEIQENIEKVSAEIARDFSQQEVFFLGVLNGSFMFFSDLMKTYPHACQLGFVRAASYEGMESSGKVTFQPPGNMDLKGKDVILVEDIVDTGNTLVALHEFLAQYEPKSVRICSLLFKREAYKASLPIDYVCFEVENKFLLGYGLDYDGLGRNTSSIYILKDTTL